MLLGLGESIAEEQLSQRGILPGWENEEESPVEFEPTTDMHPEQQQMAHRYEHRYARRYTYAHSVKCQRWNLESRLSIQ